jgi:hypothetical protein
VSTRRWLAAAVGSSLLLAACSASQGRTSQHKTTPTAVTQGGAAPAPGNPCLPGSCGASVSSTTTAPARISGAASDRALQAWGTAHLASLQALSSEATHLLAGAGDAAQVKLACAQLGTDAQVAQSSPPPPDATTAARLQGGLTQLQQLSRDCTTAFSGGDPTAASRLVYEATQGTAAITQVIQTVNGAGHPMP